MIIKTGDGTVHQVNYIGDLVGDFVGSNGETHRLTISDIRYAPSIKYSLFSLKLAMGKGYSIGNKGVTM